MQRPWVFVLSVVLLGVAVHSQAATGDLSAAPSLTAALTASILRDGANLPEASRVAPGDRVRYEVRTENVGGGDAFGVVLQCAMPEGFAYIERTTSAAWPDGRSTADPSRESDQDLRFRLDAELPAGAALTLTFEALVTSDVDEIGPYVGVATATGVDADGARIPTERSAGTPLEDAPKNVGEAALFPSRPALVTAKSVAAIVRDGEEIPTTGPIEPGDIVTYRLTVENVGRGTAYNVGVEDELPPPLSCVAGSTTASWPGGASTGDPAGAPGPFLSWPLSAVLRFGEVLALRFDAVVGSVLEDSPCVNVMTASSNDADGGPTPPDRSDEIPEDIDADDSSVAILSSTLPALSVDKEILDVHRDGVSLGVVPSAVPGDVVTYRFTIRNVGNATAYNVDFRDELPPGFEYETRSLYGEGLYVVTSPHRVGTLSVPDGGSSFMTSIDATIHAGAKFVATYTARITDAVRSGVSLENTAEAEGFSSAGVEISDSNPAIGDTRDDDVDDEDADDTGSAPIRIGMPALAVDQQTVDIERRGVSVGAAGPAEPGDVIVSRFTIRNVGTDTAYDVGFTDLLPPGLEIEGTDGARTFSVDLPPAGPTRVSFDDGAPGAADAVLGARIDCGGTLTATYRVRVTSDVAQSRPLIHETRAFGRDAAGMPIPPANPAVGDTSDDDEDDRDADDVGAELISMAEGALVTEAMVFAVVHDGAFVALPGVARPGDVVTFQVRVSNVGRGTAYGVNVEGSLPAGLTYVGPTSVVWPGGTSRTDPAHAAGASLAWSPNATLGGGEHLVLSFDVRVSDDVTRDTSLLYVARANGVDGNGLPIPADNSADVPLDWDGDDVDTVRLAVASDATAAPAITALATEMSVARIVRGGETVFDPIVEPGDRITFEWIVRNVGVGTVYDVVALGEMAPEMRYALGSTFLRWPFGVSFADPSGVLGPTLEWSPPAPLRAGESIRLTFDVIVAEWLLDERSLVTRIEVHGHEATGAPVLPDQSRTIARDIDIDDASSWSLLTRSSHLPDVGPRPVPALGWSLASVDDGLRFQTDIALYAAAELGGLAEEVRGLRSLPRAQTPACLSTFAAEAEGVALENLIEVETGSGMGVPLSAGPRFRDAGDPEAALEQRLREIACAVGLDAAQRPAGERWVLLEYAAGDPRFICREEGSAWPTGEWAAYDRRVTPSAVGMGLLAQAMAARRLLESPLARDRYLGGVLVEAMHNKVASLAELRGAPGSSNGLLAHAYAVTWKDHRVVYTVVEPRMELYDQLALMWGLAAFIEFAECVPSSWPSALGSLAGDASRARQELDRILRGIHDSLRGFDGALRESTADTADGRVRTTTLGLLLAALGRVSSAVGSGPAVERLATHAAIQLSGRVGLGGRLDSAGTETGSADTFAVVRGLLAASRILSVPAYEAVAVRVLEAFDREFWNGAVGAYLGAPGERRARLCVTPLDLGLLAGALLDASAVLPPAAATHILSRLTSHIRVLVHGAALHLAPANVADTPLGWAFVFRDRVCYSQTRP